MLNKALCKQTLVLILIAGAALADPPAAQVPVRAFADWRLDCTAQPCEIHTLVRGADGTEVLRLGRGPGEAPLLEVSTPLALYLPDGLTLAIGAEPPLALCLAYLRPDRMRRRHAADPRTARRAAARARGQRHHDAGRRRPGAARPVAGRLCGGSASACGPLGREVVEVTMLLKQSLGEVSLSVIVPRPPYPPSAATRYRWSPIALSVKAAKGSTATALPRPATVRSIPASWSCASSSEATISRFLRAWRARSALRKSARSTVWGQFRLPTFVGSRTSNCAISPS